MAPKKRTSTSVYGDLGVPELVLLPVFWLLGAAVALFTFNNVLRLIADMGSKSFAKQGPTQKMVQPYFEMLRPLVTSLFGTTHFKVDLTHLVLVAALMVLIGIWRSLHVQTQLLQQAAAREGAAEKDE